MSLSCRSFAGHSIFRFMATQSIKKNYPVTTTVYPYPDLFHKKNHGHIPTEIAAYLVTHPV